MKPPQISSNQHSSHTGSHAPPDRGNFPSTDYSYQSTVETTGSHAIAEEPHDVRELRTFRKVSKEFFGTEASREYVIEAIFFGAIVWAAAWPIAVMIRQLITMMI